MVATITLYRRQRLSSVSTWQPWYPVSRVCETSRYTRYALSPAAERQIGRETVVRGRRKVEGNGKRIRGKSRRQLGKGTTRCTKGAAGRVHRKSRAEFAPFIASYAHATLECTRAPQRLTAMRASWCRPVTLKAEHCSRPASIISRVKVFHSDSPAFHRIRSFRLREFVGFRDLGASFISVTIVSIASKCLA